MTKSGPATTSLTRWLYAMVLVAVTACVAACGGGGSSSGSSSTSTSSSSSSSSGSSTSSSSTSTPGAVPIAATASNTVQVTVNQGVANVPNIPTVSVTICVSGTANCETVDNVQVDTGSYGLRLLASTLSSISGSLPIEQTSSGADLAECPQFADGYTWGTVRTADVKIGGETATAIPIQLIGDLSTSTIPTACEDYGGPSYGSAGDSVQDTASALGANGILGIGVAPVDCGADCAPTTATSGSSFYFACPGGTNCAVTTVANSQQVANPVDHFATDNNGVIVELSPISANGAGSATGTLVFGINTESNNTLSTSAQVFQTTSSGDVGSTFAGATQDAFLDTGSNWLFFTDGSLDECSGNLAGYYCPASTQTLTATLTGVGGGAGTASFNVASASTLFSNTSNYAFNDVAANLGASSYLDLGLPFFYGRYVYFGLDLTASGGQSPYVAF